MAFVLPPYWKKISPATGSARSPSGSVAFCTFCSMARRAGNDIWGTGGGIVGLTLTAASASAHAGFRLLGLGRWLPLGIFERTQHHAVRLAGQGHLLAVDAQRKIADGQFGARPFGAE